ncbi:acyl-CoA thioesterase [Candidatus Omnitrophota bacterium]
MNTSEGRLIKRKTQIVPKLYDLDMQAVVYNANYFKWFDQARFELILEMISIDEIIETGMTFMIAENKCEYKNYASYGEPLVLFTSHRIQPTYQGRLVFNHSIMHEKKKTEIATGYSSMVVVNHKTKQLIKELPDFIWQRYTNLK